MIVVMPILNKILLESFFDTENMLFKMSRRCVAQWFVSHWSSMSTVKKNWEQHKIIKYNRTYKHRATENNCSRQRRQQYYHLADSTGLTFRFSGDIYPEQAKHSPKQGWHHHQVREKNMKINYFGLWLTTWYVVCSVAKPEP